MTNTYNALIVSERIKFKAKANKVAVSTMLQDLELNKNTVYMIQKRGSFLTSDSLAKIADYLDCSVDYLLGRTENPNSHKLWYYILTMSI